MYKNGIAPQAVKSKNMIVDALFELMKHYQYHDINISRICTKAKVSRVTFYRNFTEKNDIIRCYLQTIGSCFNCDIDTKNLTALLANYYNFLRTYKTRLTLIKKNNLDFLIKENIIVVIEKFNLSTFDIYQN